MGSEMCIRDRVNPVWPSLAHGPVTFGSTLGPLSLNTRTPPIATPALREPSTRRCEAYGPESTLSPSSGNSVLATLPHTRLHIWIRVAKRPYDRDHQSKRSEIRETGTPRDVTNKVGDLSPLVYIRKRACDACQISGCLLLVQRIGTVVCGFVGLYSTGPIPDRTPYLYPRGACAVRRRLIEDSKVRVS